jgi:hypothetical protein
MWPASNENPRNTGKRDTACHPLVEPTDGEGKTELRLRRGDPLQHVPMTYEEAEECSHDRIRHEPRFVREERDVEADL